MELIASDEFLRWAGRLGIAPDVRWDGPLCLTYVPYRSHGRFWDVPKRASAVPALLAHMLGGLERWCECRLWPRGGRWPDMVDAGGDDDDRPPIHDPVLNVILGGAGIPAGHAGAVRYDWEERDRLLAAVFGHLVFGWMSSHDLFILPDHGRYVLHTDHHDVVHVNFRDEADVGPFVAHMARAKYTLPDAVPDGTFKTPGWMP